MEYQQIAVKSAQVMAVTFTFVAAFGAGYRIAGQIYEERRQSVWVEMVE
jgi:hypothetical protein